MKLPTKSQLLEKIKGFTLIELLVVISIIGILITVASVSFTSAQKQARDTRRKSDLKQYQSSLEIYSNKNSGAYPVHASVLTGTSFAELCTYLGLTTCPNDPKYISTDASPIQYSYQTDGTLNNGSAAATKYILWAKLENSSTYWVVCSSGSVFSNATSPTIANCP